MTRHRTLPLRHSCEGRNPAPTKTPAPAANPIHPQNCDCWACLDATTCPICTTADKLTGALIALTLLALGAATGALIHWITQCLWSTQP